jgi:hypothetical protein
MQSHLDPNRLPTSDNSEPQFYTKLHLRQSWPLAIPFHWRTRRLWATHPRTQLYNIIYCKSPRWWQWHWSSHRQWSLPWTKQHHQHLRWSTWPSTKRDTLHHKRKWPYISEKNVVNLHHLFTPFTLQC